jgi:histidine phosphotransferase ChpT
MRGDGGMDETDLAALVGARLCHDLISPLGAIGNGVELLQMQAGADRPEISLIASAVASANARIRFLRVAFGSASADHRMAQAEIVRLLDDWTGGSRLKVVWAVPGDQSRSDIRLVFLALQCVESALPRGGVVTVDRLATGWLLRAQAAQVRLLPDLWALIGQAGAAAPLQASQVQFGLLAGALQRTGRRARLEPQDQGLTLWLG